jgi:hypothetical protein
VEKRLIAHSYQRQPTEIVADVHELSPRERWRRAAWASGLLGFAAIVCLPIPVVHLASPVLLVAAVAVGHRRLRELRRYQRAAGPCPACKLTTELPLPASARLPLTLPCPLCGEFLRLGEAS